MRIVLRLRAEVASLAAVALTMHVGCGAHQGAPPETERSYWPAEARFASVPSDVTRLRLATEKPDDVGILRDHGGTYLCALPCTVLVPPRSGWFVEIGTHTGKLRTVDVPDAFDDAPPGSTARAVVQPKRGHPGAALTFIVGGALLSGLGAICIKAAAQSGGTRDWAGDAFGPACLGAVGVGFPMLIGGLIWSGLSQAPSFDIQ